MQLAEQGEVRYTLADEGDGVPALDVALTQPTSARAERGRYRSEVVTASSPPQFTMVAGTLATPHNNGTWRARSSTWMGLHQVSPGGGTGTNYTLDTNKDGIINSEDDIDKDGDRVGVSSGWRSTDSPATPALTQHAALLIR